jgi:hypothetical protein
VPLHKSMTPTTVNVSMSSDGRYARAFATSVKTAIPTSVATQKLPHFPAAIFIFLVRQGSFKRSAPTAGYFEYLNAR